jgi:hypothetical protein
MRQLAALERRGYQHSVGTSIAADRAASRMVDPSAMVTDRPLMVSVGTRATSGEKTTV